MRFSRLVCVVVLLSALQADVFRDTRAVGQSVDTSTASDVKPFNHCIRFQIEKVTPVEKSEGADLYELKVKRWYGKIPSDVLALKQTQETQEFTILFPAPSGAVVKEGDILEYQIIRYLRDDEGEAATTEKPKQLDYTRWVEKCLKDFSQLKPGMRRAEVEMRFPQDGGWADAGEYRFVHPECPCIKVDVKFSFQRNEHDQGRAITSPEDPVTTVSKPYLEYAICD